MAKDYFATFEGKKSESDVTRGEQSGVQSARSDRRWLCSVRLVDAMAPLWANGNYGMHSLQHMENVRRTRVVHRLKMKKKTIRERTRGAGQPSGICLRRYPVMTLHAREAATHSNRRLGAALK